MKRRTVKLPDGSRSVEVDVEDELSSAKRAENEARLRELAQNALETNRAFLDLRNPTPAQTAAQVRTLTQECSAVIQLLLNRLDRVG